MPPHHPTSPLPESSQGPAWSVVILLPVLFCLGCIWVSLVRHHDDPFAAMDTDDAMRMVQVLDLYRHGSWYDLTQHRLNPPEGVRMHWSRLPDLPLLATYSICAHFFDQDRAVQWTAILIPSLLAILYYTVFLWTAAPLIDKTYLPTVSIVCLCLITPMVQFKPYRVDHHGWQIILALITLGSLLRANSSTYTRSPLMYGGIAGALGLWIGAEAYPPIGFACIALTLQWIVSRDNAADHLAVYGLSLVGGVALIYPLALAPNDWGAKVPDAFSLVSLGLALAIYGYGVCLTKLNHSKIGDTLLVRATAALVIAGFMCLILLIEFKEILNGPYGHLSPAIKELVENTIESKPLIKNFSLSPFSSLAMILLPVFAIAISGMNMAHSQAQTKWQWFYLLIFISGGILLQFWQIRTSSLSVAFAGIAISWWAIRCMQQGERLTNTFARVGVFCLPILCVQALEFGPHLLEKSAVKEATERLIPNMQNVLSLLNDTNIVGRDSLLIAAHANIGPRLLLQTKHQVLAAPYHRNNGGLQATNDIFGSDERLSQQIIQDRKVDLLYVYGQHKNNTSSAQPSTASSAPPSLWTRLQQGDHPPWLEEIPLPQASEGEHLYRPVRTPAQ